MPAKPSIVFAHGLWADGSCYSKVIPALGLERFVAKRMGARTYGVDSSHVPMLSHPGFVLDVIRDAAKAV
jgi:hypothetical protein